MHKQYTYNYNIKKHLPLSAFPLYVLRLLQLKVLLFLIGKKYCFAYLSK